MGEGLEVGSGPVAADTQPPTGDGVRPSTVAWTIAALLALVLAVTTAVASFVEWIDYLPEASIARCDIATAAVCDAADGAALAVDWRLGAVSAAATLALAIGGWAMVRTFRTRTRRPAIAAVAALASSALALVTGALGGSLLWDQLAMWDVEAVGPGRFRGLGWLFDERADSVRFVIVGGAESGVATLRTVALLTVGSAVGAFALLAVALVLLRPPPGEPVRGRRQSGV